MFRHYEKTFRILVPGYLQKGKHFLTKEEVKRLLGGRVVVEEKFDGANIGIIRHKTGFTLQKKGSLVAQSEHAQFNYFWSWSRDYYGQLMQMPQGYVLYGELLYAVHTIFYDRLPDLVLIFEVWDGTNYLKRRAKEEFCQG